MLPSVSDCHRVFRLVLAIIGPLQAAVIELHELLDRAAVGVGHAIYVRKRQQLLADVDAATARVPGAADLALALLDVRCRHRRIATGVGVGATVVVLFLLERCDLQRALRVAVQRLLLGDDLGPGVGVPGAHLVLQPLGLPDELAHLVEARAEVLDHGAEQRDLPGLLEVVGLAVRRRALVRLRLALRAPPGLPPRGPPRRRQAAVQREAPLRGLAVLDERRQQGPQRAVLDVVEAVQEGRRHRAPGVVQAGGGGHGQRQRARPLEPHLVLPPAAEAVGGAGHGHAGLVHHAIHEPARVARLHHLQHVPDDAVLRPEHRLAPVPALGRLLVVLGLLEQGRRRRRVVVSKGMEMERELGLAVAARAALELHEQQLVLPHALLEVSDLDGLGARLGVAEELLLAFGFLLVSGGSMVVVVVRTGAQDGLALARVIVVVLVFVHGRWLVGRMGRLLIVVDAFAVVLHDNVVWLRSCTHSCV
uniref:Uncharacterized protein n=1 Tax=Zea mays TaxID=4577 RepID=A0A804MF91_MAIZE